jgi:hypothetical protein
MRDVVAAASVSELSVQGNAQLGLQDDNNNNLGTSASGD